MILQITWELIQLIEQATLDNTAVNKESNTPIHNSPNKPIKTHTSLDLFEINNFKPFFLQISLILFKSLRSFFLL